MRRNQKYRALRRALKCYPKNYQRKFGKQFLQTTEDMLDSTENGMQKMLVWTRIWIDLPLSIAVEQSRSVGAQLNKNAPSYMKRNAILSALLLVPFFLSLLANGFSKVTFNTSLNDSWLWKSPFINLWVLWLPELALGITVISFLIYVFGKSNKDKPAKRLFSPSRYWPIIIPAVLSLIILGIVAFHDSVSCWIQNPVQDVTKFRAVWQCSTNNQSLPIFRKYF